MKAAAKGSKRSRAAEASSSPVPSTSAAPAQVLAAAPPSSNLAPARPLSAVAARRAARDAAQAAGAAPRASATAYTDAVPTEQTRPDVADQQVPTGDDVTMKPGSPSPTTTSQTVSSDDEAEAPAPHKRARSAPRYFASSEETAGRRAPNSRPQGTAQSRTSSEVQDDYTPLEQDVDVATAWESPRANRRRREKPSVLRHLQTAAYVGS